MIAVKLQSLVQGHNVWLPAGRRGQSNGFFGRLPGVIKTARLGAGHAQRVEHKRLRAVTQKIRPGRVRQRRLAVADRRVCVGGQHAGDLGENLKIVRIDTQSGAELFHRLGVAALFEQQLEYADVVVLNKIDALDEDALLLAEQRVRDRAPNVRFL